jgi:uncharacterized protein (TIRG00374 family)
MVKFWRNLMIGVLVSAFFLWLAFRDVNWPEFQSVLQNARWGYLPLIMVVYVGVLTTRAIRWYYLMDGRVRWWSVFHIHNIGFLINSTLPFRIGELARAYLISREQTGVSAWAVLSTILTERILDVLALVVILVLLLPFLPLEANVVTAGLLAGGVAVVAFGVLLASARKPAWIYALLNLILRFLPFLQRLKPVQLVDRVLDGLKPLTSRRGLLRIGFWSVIAWALAILEVWTLALLFPDWPQTTASYAGLALALVGASLSIVIPFTPAGVGPFEAAVIFALGVGGVPPELRATFAIVWHTGLVLFYGLWGVIGLMALGLSLGQVWRGAAVFGKQPIQET